MRNNCDSYREKFLKFEAEGKEFAKLLRSLEQFVRKVKDQNNFGKKKHKHIHKSICSSFLANLLSS